MNFAQPIATPIIAPTPPTYGSVLPIDGQLTSVAFSSPHTVTGSNAQGAVYRRVGLAGTWQHLPAPPGVTRVSVSDDGTTFATTSQEQIVRFVNGQWTQVPGAAKTVAVGNASTVYCANAGGQLWRLDPMSGQWAHVPASFQAVDVSVGADGTLYAVDAADGIHRFEPMLGQWTTIPGQLVQISVHDANTVVGVNRQGAVYQLNPASNAWTHLSQVPAASRVAAATDGLYVVCADQSVKHVSAAAPIQLAAAQAAAQAGSMMGAMFGAMGAAFQQPVQQPVQQPAFQQSPFMQSQPQPQVGFMQQPPTQVAMAPGFGFVQAGAPPTVFTPAVVGPCKKCQGKGGLGTFGPCEPGHMHFKAICPVCQGQKVSALQSECQLCQMKGGLSSFGSPCEASPPHMHYKAACPACNGMGLVARPQTKCNTCQGHGGFDTWSKPAVKTAMHYKQDCSACGGRAFF
jgi:hypothetical protein